MASQADVVTLGGQAFPVMGKITSAPLSPFEDGIKVGPTNYDHREHAFFATFDDWTGGFGERRLDIRSALGSYWYAEPTNAPETAFAGRVTLPPYQAFVSIPNPPSQVSPGEVSYPFKETATSYLFGLGSAIYRLATLGGTPTKVLEPPVNAARVTSIIAATEKTAAVRRLYVAWANGNIIPHISIDDGVTWTPIDPTWAPNITAGPGTIITSVALERGQIAVSDLFYWDNKVFGSYLWLMAFLVPAAGVRIPYGGPLQFYAAGQEPWNYMLPQDRQWLATSEENVNLKFLGAAPGPSGDMNVYMRAGSKLAALDVFARKISFIDISMGAKLRCGCMWNGAAATSDGWNIYLYNPRGQDVKNIGFPKKWGIPPNLQNTTGDGAQEIVALIPSDDFLYAVVVDIVAINTTLYRYNNTGWNQVGRRMDGFCAYYGFEGVFPVTYVPAFSDDINRAIILPGTIGLGGTSPTSGYWYFQLPNLTQQPTYGRDTVGNSGATLYTGWMDLGFAELFGTLLRMDVDGWNLSATETVEVSYRLDNDETAAWVLLTDTTGTPARFNGTNRSLYFGSGLAYKRGLKFRTVQFRVTLYRGSDATKTPELRALTLVYLKTPELRLSWAFQIDVNHMIATSKSGDDTTFYVDSQPATLANVWAKLQTLWTNSHVLLQMIIPNIAPDPGVNVKISEMPLTFDDFRDAVTGQGGVQIQVLQPVE